MLVLFAGACTSSDDSGSTSENEEETSETTGSDEAPEEAEYVSDADYSDQSIWLCHPAVDGDACDIDLDATLIAADGTTTVEPFEPLVDAPVDCFYLYPTSSTDPGENSDLVPDSEAAMAHNQIARFAEVCNVYAPMYRSIPLGALFDRIEERQAEENDESGSSEDEGDEEPEEAADSSEPAPAEFAYADVEAAFAHYMAEDNDGKPFVLVGHSQGSGMMRTLVSEQIDDEDEVRAQLLSTMMIGTSVRSDSEGDPEFANIPPCESPDQTGCVISFATFYEDEPPPESSFFGRRDPEDGARVLCTNPAHLAGGSGPLSSYYGAGGTETVAVTTPWVHYEGLLVSECVSSEDVDWLQITNTRQEGDARPADVGGRLTPEWGTHLSDVNMTIGNLIELVKTQSGGE